MTKFKTALESSDEMHNLAKRRQSLYLNWKEELRPVDTISSEQDHHHEATLSKGHTKHTTGPAQLQSEE